MSSPGGLRRWARPALSLLVIGCVALFVVRSTRLEDFARAIDRLPVPVLVAGYFLGVFNIALGATRWRVLMRAFGARTLATRGEFLLTTFVAHFYNTFVPGSFGGDLVRGFVTRKSFDQPATGLIVVFFERVVGLFALLCVAAVGVFVGPRIIDLSTGLPWLVGLSAAGALVLGAAALTGRLTRFRDWLPRITAPRLLWPALGISFLGHGVNLAIYLMLAHGMNLGIPDSTVLMVVPLGLIATVVPIALAGIGAREATLVGLLVLLGVETSDAVVYSLGFPLTTIALALTGGVIQLVQPKVLRYH